MSDPVGIKRFSIDYIEKKQLDVFARNHVEAKRKAQAILATRLGPKNFTTILGTSVRIKEETPT